MVEQVERNVNRNKYWMFVSFTSLHNKDDAEPYVCSSVSAPYQSLITEGS